MKNLKHTEGRVVVYCDLEAKNSWRFADGTTIRYERGFDNFNKREVSPVNAIVVSAENIPSGSEILIHHNACEDNNKIFNYQPLSGEETSSDIKYFSIPEEMCFIWKDADGNWQPIPPYETALRIFIPYKGAIEGIEPTQIKDTLWVTSGELKNKAVATLKGCDYQIVFQDTNGKEGNIIRFRPFGDERSGREEEAIAIMNTATEKILNGEYYVGLTTTDAKPLENINAYAD